MISKILSVVSAALVFVFGSFSQNVSAANEEGVNVALTVRFDDPANAKNIGDFQTIKINQVAKFKFSGVYYSKPEPTSEAEPGAPEWEFVSVTCSPDEPEVTRSVPSPTNWTSGEKISGSDTIKSSKEGDWSLTYTASVRFPKLSKSDGKHMRDDEGNLLYFGPYSASANVTLKVTKYDFKIKLVSNDNFPGHAELTFGLLESGVVQAWSLDGQTQYRVVRVKCTSDDIMFSSNNAFYADVTPGTAEIEVEVEDNNRQPLGKDTVTASVIEPSGAYVVMDPNILDYEHTQGSFHLAYRCKYILTPNNVSFAKIRKKEWGDKKDKNGRETGIAIYKGDPDPAKNYFAIPMLKLIGSEHPPTSEWIPILSCNETHSKTKGRYINIEKGWDITGLSPVCTFPPSGPTEGNITLALLVRYQVETSLGDVENNIPTTIISDMSIKKSGNDHVITVRKTGTSLTKTKDSESKSFTYITPPVL